MKRPEILRKQEDFARLYRNGKSSGSRYLVLLYRKNGLPYNRKAFLASKKVGNSVIRHRIRRLIKESFRLHISEWPEAQYVFVARREASGKSFRDIESAMLALGKKAGLSAAGETPVQKPL